MRRLQFENGAVHAQTTSKTPSDDTDIVLPFCPISERPTPFTSCTSFKLAPLHPRGQVRASPSRSLLLLPADSCQSALSAVQDVAVNLHDYQPTPSYQPDHTCYASCNSAAPLVQQQQLHC